MPAGELSRVAVDLTPVLPGGDNGGAKVFAIALVRALGEAHPGTRFTLLTQAASHDELAVLDAPNVTRLQVLGSAGSQGRAGAASVASRVLAHMPAFARRRAGDLAYAVNARLKRRRAGLLARIGADLLFCPFTAPTFREAGVPVVATLYDCQFADYPQFFAPEDVAHRARALREAGTHADAVAAISSFSRDRAVVLGFVDAQRTHVVPLRVGARPIAAEAPPAELRNRPYLLYPANYWRHKNHEMLLTAFAMARRSGLGDVALVLTGAPGARETALRAAVAAMGLADHVTFAGFVPDAEFAGLLAGARAVVFPSLYEGFGMPVIEAMAAGVPVACANVTALPEVAGDAALTFDPRRAEAIASAMVTIANDEPLRTDLVARGRDRAAAFADPARMAEDYWRLFVDARAMIHA